MIKKNVFILIFSLFAIFTTGCAERNVKLNAPAQQRTTLENKDEAIPTLRLRNSREDQIQQTVSGSLILLIGLIILL